MSNDGDKVSDVDDNMHVFLGMESIKVFDVDGNGRLQGLFEHLCSSLASQLHDCRLDLTFAIHDLLCVAREYRLAVFCKHVELFSLVAEILDVFTQDP